MQNRSQVLPAVSAARGTTTDAQDHAGAKKRPWVRFTPHKLIGALIVLLPTIFVFGVVQELIPDEEIPRQVVEADGSTTFHLNSREDVLLGITFVVALLVFGYLGCRYYLCREQLESGPRWPVAMLFALIVGMFLWLVVRTTYYDIGVVNVSQNSIVLSSFTRSWEIPRQDLARVVVHSEVRKTRNHARVELQLQLALTTKSREEYESKLTSFDADTPDAKQYEDFLKLVQRELQK